MVLMRKVAKAIYLSNVFLYKLGSNYTNEASICSISHGPCTQSFTSSGRPEKQDALGRLNAKIDELLRLENYISAMSKLYKPLNLMEEI